MHQVILGKVSILSQEVLPETWLSLAPTGANRAKWIAGRVLLAHALAPLPLPEIIYGKNGKPAFRDEIPLWFNLSHSGDDIVLLFGNEGDVGCDIEILRPRKYWRQTAESVFSAGEQTWLATEREDQQLAMFWRIWTRKEAMLKRTGGHIWQIANFDSTSPQHGFVSDLTLTDGRMLAICTPTPYPLSPDNITFFPSPAPAVASRGYK